MTFSQVQDYLKSRVEDPEIGKLNLEAMRNDFLQNELELTSLRYVGLRSKS